MRALLVVLIGISVVGAVLVVVNVTGPAATCTSDPLANREIAELGEFTSWLTANDVKGYIGEVGWPGGADSDQWNDVADDWYQAADRAGLWVSAWAAGGWWPDSYPMVVYRLDGGTDGVDSAGTQAAVVEAHSHVGNALRGVDIASGAFGTSEDGNRSYSNAAPGTYGADYSYEDSGGYQYLASHGVSIVRISFTWERLQPKLGQPLDPASVARLRKTIGEASAAGLGVVLDLHNYGAYWMAGKNHTTERVVLGSDALPAAALADFWQRLVVSLRGEPGVLGYGLMNEPGRLAADPKQGARLWEVASQGVVDAVRATGDRRTVFVASYGSSSPNQWQEYHPRAWIVDPARAVRYEAHQYFDGDGSGRYRSSLADEEAVAASAAPASALCNVNRSRWPWSG